MIHVDSPSEISRANLSITNTSNPRGTLSDDNSGYDQRYLRELRLTCQNLVDSICERNGGELPELIFRGKTIEEWMAIQNNEPRLQNETEPKYQ